MKFKKGMYSLIAVFSACTLAFSGIVNAGMVSGYTSFMEAVRNTVNLPNATVSGAVFMTVNGERIGNSHGNFLMQYDLENELMYSTNKNDSGAGNVYENYRVGNKMIYTDYELDEDGKQVYNVYGYGETAQINDMSYGNWLTLEPKYIDFGEKVIDALSGNMKEYLVKQESDEGYSITASLERVQIPELVNSFMDIMVPYRFNNMGERIENGYEPRENSLGSALAGEVISSAYISSVTLDSHVSDEDYLEYCEIAVNANFVSGSGEELPVEIMFEFNVTDVGSTEIAEPDLNNDDIVVKEHDASNSVYIHGMNNDEVWKEYNDAYITLEELLSSDELTEEDREELIEKIKDLEKYIENFGEEVKEPEITEDKDETEEVNEETEENSQNDNREEESEENNGIPEDSEYLEIELPEEDLTETETENPEDESIQE